MKEYRNENKNRVTARALRWLLLALCLLALLGGVAMASEIVVTGGDGTCTDDSQHIWDSGETTTTPTCSIDGVKTYHCTICGAVGTENIGKDPNKHVNTVIQNQRDATCTAKGYSGNTFCNDCYTTIAYGSDIDELHHAYEYVPAVTATCKDPGMQEHYRCKSCGHFFSDNAGNGEQTTEDTWVTPVNPDNHDWIEDTAVAATCTTGGYTPYHCSRCEATKQENAQTALGHDMTPYAAVAATCTKAGNIAYWHCERCNTNFSDEQGTAVIADNDRIIPALGHNMTATTAVAATCTTAGNSAYWYCGRCQKYFSDADGSTEIAENSWVITALGHNLTEHAAEAATCTEAGTKAYWSCDRCNKNFRDATCATEFADADRIIPATGHTPKDPVQENVVPATCTEAGSHDNVVYCDVCHNVVSSTHVVDDALGHDMTATEAEAATCTTAGNSAYWTCKRCGKYFSDKDGKTPIDKDSWVLPAAHTLTKYDAVAPTTAKDGNKLYWYCTVCKKCFSDEAATQETTLEAVTLPMLKIVSFEAVTTRNSTYKPTLEKAAALFPSPLNATVMSGEDKTTVQTVPVTLTWTCADYANGGDKDYTFTATLAAGSPQLAEGVAAPTAILHVAPATSGDYTYRLNDEGTATIIGWSGKDTELIVPAKLGEAAVTGIADGVFKDKTALTRLELPAGVKTIGENAFAGCTALTSLTLPDSLESLATTALTGDEALTSIVLRCNGNTTLNPTNTINHDDAVNGVPAPVVLPEPYAFTDLTVATNADATVNGRLTVACDFKLASGHAILVEAGTLTNNKTLTNLGTITITNGAFTNTGSVLSCAGTVTGSIGGSGTYKANGVHSYKDGKCEVCGVELPKLEIKYNGKAISKTYDKTRNVTLKASEFSIVDTHGLDVSISGISASYDKPDAGERTVNVTLKLSGNDAALYGNKVTTKVSATIEPKPLIITPTAGQKKTFGAADPSNYTGKVRGLLSGDKISGKLSRKDGENVGKYLIEQGTIDAGANYDVQVVEEYFTIEAKSINSSDVGLVPIGNQRYTGEEIKPAITLRYGTRTLVQDTDFKATFTDNVQPGMAKVTLTGMGNYTGSRETTFRILNISSGVDPSSGGGGYSGYSYGGFSDGEGESPDDYAEEDADLGKLLLNGSDYGVILYDANGQPCSFVQHEEPVVPENPDEPLDENAPQELVLTIIADPMTNPQTGETLLLDDGEREQYDELHLRLSTQLIQMLRGMGYVEIVYELENAELHIPLASLAAEIELEQEAEPEVISIIEGEETETGEYEGDIEELEMDLAPATLQIDAYDFCIEQSEVAVLSEREITLLNGYTPLMPTYRVHVRAVFTSDEEEAEAAPVELGPDGLPIETLEEAKRLPENGYPEGLVLNVLPLEALDDETALTDATALFISTVETTEDDDVVETNPVQLVEKDEQTYSKITLKADGLYAVGCPIPEDGELEQIDG